MRTFLSVLNSKRILPSTFVFTHTFSTLCPFAQAEPAAPPLQEAFPITTHLLVGMKSTFRSIGTVLHHNGVVGTAGCRVPPRQNNFPSPLLTNSHKFSHFTTSKVEIVKKPSKETLPQAANASAGNRTRGPSR
jgi:hypothetical protein